jgi:hypothetical protein
MTYIPLLRRKYWLHYHSFRWTAELVTTLGAALLLSYVIVRTGG